MIILQLTGNDAVKKAEKIFYPTDPNKAKKWSSQWDCTTKRNATFVVYYTIPKTKPQYGFKFIIGDIILGENYKDTEKIINFFKNLNKPE